MIDVRRVRLARVAALVLWGGFALAIAIIVATHPGQRTVTPTYHLAASAWFAGRALYKRPEDVGGFQYFPQAALVYAAFTALPHEAGEVVWRLSGLVLLATDHHAGGRHHRLHRGRARPAVEEQLAEEFAGVHHVVDELAAVVEMILGNRAVEGQ